MGSVITNLIMRLIDWIRKNYKNPKLWVGGVLLVAVVFWLVPYIDSNFYYYDRMEKRVSILQQLTELDQDKISSNAILQQEYEDILSDIQVQEERMVTSIVTNMTNSINNVFKVKPKDGKVWLKFLSGAALSMIITLCIPFMNTFSRKKEKIYALIMMLVIACILGGVGAMCPTIIHPKVNYWGMPIIQLVGLIVLVMKSSKTDENKE